MKVVHGLKRCPDRLQMEAAKLVVNLHHSFSMATPCHNLQDLKFNTALLSTNKSSRYSARNLSSLEIS